MNCPTCDTYTEVLETRTNPDGKRRRYECANMHRFTTQEVLVPPRGEGPMRIAARLRQQRREESYAGTN